MEDDNEKKEPEAPNGAAIECWERIIHGSLLLACLKLKCIISKKVSVGHKPLDSTLSPEIRASDESR